MTRGRGLPRHGKSIAGSEGGMGFKDTDSHEM